MSIIDIKDLQQKLCKDLCLNVRIEKRGELYCIDTPFCFPDGDSYQIYLEKGEDGKARLTDKGHLLMQMSYDMDIDTLYKGARNNLRKKILGEVGMKETEDGEFYIDTPIEYLGEEIFTFGQGLTRVYDLLLLQRSHVSSDFYDDLEGELCQMLGKKKIKKDYLVEGIENKELYQVDFFFKGKNDKQVYLYGIPNSNKARLTTVCLEHFNSKKLEFESLLIFEDIEKIAKKDVERLRNVGGEIASWDAKDDLHRKIMQRAA